MKWPWLWAILAGGASGADLPAFPQRVDLASGEMGAWALGNADGAGTPELAVVFRGDEVRLFGAPWTGAAATAVLGNGIDSLIWADVDHDGADELVVADEAGFGIQEVAVGPLGFAGSVAVIRAGAVTTAPNRVLGVGDFDGDLWVDLLVLDAATEGLAWLENPGGTGAWTLREIEPSVADAVSGEWLRAEAVVVVDGDGDGDPDVYAGLPETGGELFFFENDGSGTFTRQVVAGVGLLGVFPLLEAGDIDPATNDVELVTAPVGISFFGEAELPVRRLTGSGAALTSEVLSLELAVGEIEVADLDGDGREDVVLAEGTAFDELGELIGLSPEVRWKRQRADGTLSPWAASSGATDTAATKAGMNSWRMQTS